MMAILTSILKLAVLIFGEYLSAKKRAREAQEKYELDMAKFEKLATDAIIQMRLQVAQDSQAAGTMDDVMDEEIRRSKANETPKEG